MKQITFNSNFGRFNYSITATVGDDVNEATTNLCIRGLADTGFRGVSSEVEKALAYKPETETTDASGIEGVTKETKRSEIPFSDEAVEIIQRVGQSKLDEIAAKAKLPQMTFKVTGEHAFGESEQSRAMGTALWNKAKDDDAMRMALGAADDTTDEEGIELAHKFLATLRKPRSK